MILIRLASRNGHIPPSTVVNSLETPKSALAVIVLVAISFTKPQLPIFVVEVHQSKILGCVARIGKFNDILFCLLVSYFVPSQERYVGHRRWDTIGEGCRNGWRLR